MPPAKAAQPGSVVVEIPLHYGSFHVPGPDGKERELRGGDIAEVPERVAAVYGLKAYEAPKPKVVLNHDSSTPLKETEK